MFEYKFGACYTDLSGAMGCGHIGYPPNMSDDDENEYTPESINDKNCSDYNMMGNNIINLFVKQNSDFIFPEFRYNRTPYINTFVYLRYIRYYLRYVNINEYQYFLKFLEAKMFDEMKKEYDKIMS